MERYHIQCPKLLIRSLFDGRLGHIGNLRPKTAKFGHFKNLIDLAQKLVQGSVRNQEQINNLGCVYSGLIYHLEANRALYIFDCQISLFQKKFSDFIFFYTKMTVVSRAINPWDAHPRPRPLTAAAAKKRRQFERNALIFITSTQ